MASYSLDDIVAAAEAKYANVTIDMGAAGTVVLLNALRLPFEERQKLIALQAELEEASKPESDVDQAALLAEGIRIVANRSKESEILLKQVGTDMSILAGIFNNYQKDTQAGEASASDD